SGGTPTGGSTVGGSGGTPTGGSMVGGSGGTPTGGSMVGGAGGIPIGGSGGTPTGGTSSGGEATGGIGETGGAGGTGGGGGSICPYTPPEDPATFPQGWTSGEVTVFNSNGGWTWYNDERVVVDPDAGKIIISSAESSASSEGTSPNIDAVIHDLATGANDKMLLGTMPYSDDHNNGGILILGLGQYFVGWAHHNKDCVSHWRNYEGGAWGAERTFDWTSQGCLWPPPQGSSANPSGVTYNNPWRIDDKYYNFVRAVETSPSILVSDDGKAWALGGRLTASPRTGYNAGYYKFWGNNVDRVDFFATEAHPRDADTSVYHGYVQGGKSYDSSGTTPKDDDILDTDAPEIIEFTKVFAAGGTLHGVTLHNLWNLDIARYEDGTIGVLWQGREVQCADKNNCDPKHHVLYSRFDRTAWTSTYLVKGGRTLYRDHSDWWEEDYLGGAALDPDDPHVIYVSTNIDPRDNSTEYAVNEIWKGVSCEDGAPFQWTPITMNSPDENLRPVVPKWNAQNTALLWFRGNYQTAQKYSAEVVGIITRQ
ncbi:MAG: hypothetical protein JW751_12330, partial [Polyangiaceae bacterium]|nr:hypothetical protein [Polyangiaceae bacterium]